MGLFAGCSNDTLTGDDPDGELNGSKDAVYMNVSVQLPAGGGIARSETNTPENGDYGTSTGGTEEGKDYENNVGEVLLVLATTDDKFIAHSIVEETNNARKVLTESSFNTTKKISKSILGDYYSKDNVDPNGNLKNDEIHVYVFCNPTQDLKTVITAATQGSTDWVNAIANVSEEIWKEKSFLMSNAVIAKKKLPKKLDYWNDYTSESKAFDLSGNNGNGTDKEVNNAGAIKVERSVARFDFKDASEVAEVINKAVVGMTKTGNYIVFTNAAVIGKGNFVEKNIGLGVSAVAMENSTAGVAGEYWFDGEKVDVPEA